MVSQETLIELTSVLSRDKFNKYISSEDRQQFLHLLGGVVRVVAINQRISACCDPKDGKFLDVALNGEAQVIVTGDQDLLELHPFHGIEILCPSDFLRMTID